VRGAPLDDVADGARGTVSTPSPPKDKPRELGLRETVAPMVEAAQDNNLGEAERCGVEQFEDSIDGRLGNGCLQRVFEALSENQRQTLRLHFA
jgi:hypothetical protein